MKRAVQSIGYDPLWILAMVRDQSLRRSGGGITPRSKKDDPPAVHHPHGGHRYVPDGYAGSELIMGVGVRGDCMVRPRVLHQCMEATPAVPPTWTRFVA